MKILSDLIGAITCLEKDQTFIELTKNSKLIENFGNQKDKN